MKKSNLINSIFGIICSVSFSYGQYIADPSFTQDNVGRVGHSNSDPIVPPTGGGMEAPKCVYSDGTYVYSAGSSSGQFSIVKKNASTGANIIVKELNVGFLTTGVSNTDKIVPRSITVDPILNRIYVVGHSTSSNKGLILCLKTSNLTLDNTFYGNTIYYFEAGSLVTDIIANSNSELLVTRNYTGKILISLHASSGGALLTKTISSTTNNFSSKRMKKYTGMSNRYFIVGNSVNISTGISCPAVFGFDHNTTKTTQEIKVVCESGLNLGAEGIGIYFDVCFPFNSSTNKYDIVCVGSSSELGTGLNGEGIYIKYFGYTTVQVNPVNLAINSTYKNQSTLPGKGIASNESNTTNMTVFSGCEAIGSQVLVCGAFGNSSMSPHDLVVGLINITGTNYSTIYHAPVGNDGTRVIHYPGRPFYDLVNNKLYFVGCDYGLSVLKMKQL